MKKDIKQMNINHRALPVFSDRSITASQVASKAGKDKKTAERKEGTIRIIFLDSVTNSAVADVVMSSIAAEQLADGLKKSVEKVRQETEDMSMPNVPSQESPVKQEHTYIG